MVDRRAMLEEVIQYNRRPRLADDEFLIEQYREEWAEEHGKTLPESTARGQIKRMVQEGILDERWVFHGGHRKRAYKLKGEDGGISDRGK